MLPPELAYSDVVFVVADVSGIILPPGIYVPPVPIIVAGTETGAVASGDGVSSVASTASASVAAGAVADAVAALAAGAGVGAGAVFTAGV